jgi:protein-S-isoprenylcysteine O-methyltransferase Ste14
MYLAVFLPSSELLGANHRFLLVWMGLFVTILGQAIRCATIGLAYIERGGKDKKVYASELVTEGIFGHCRNPLYVGNVLKLVGIGVLANSALYMMVFVPIFLFIYQAIVLAEEDFLMNKFGQVYQLYCQRVNRWMPQFKGLMQTFQSMSFRWQRPVVKELSALYIWLVGISWVLLIKYPEITWQNIELRNKTLLLTFCFLTALYLGVRYLKKSNRLQGL